MDVSEDHASRRARVCRRLATADLDACVVLAPETQLWLCGLDSFISGVLPQALVLPQDETAEPALVVWDADVPLARATSAIEDIRAYLFGVDDPAAAFAAVVREKAPGAQQIGFDGASRAVPHALGAALGAAVAPAELIDCSALLADVRMGEVTARARLPPPRRAACGGRTGRRARARTTGNLRAAPGRRDRVRDALLRLGLSVDPD